MVYFLRVPDDYNRPPGPPQYEESYPVRRPVMFTTPGRSAVDMDDVAGGFDLSAGSAGSVIQTGDGPAYLSTTTVDGRASIGSLPVSAFPITIGTRLRLPSGTGLIGGLFNTGATNKYIALNCDATRGFEYYVRTADTAFAPGFSVAFSSITDSQIHDIVCISASATDHRIYVDGVLKDTSTDSTSWPTGMNITGVGGFFDSSPGYSVGEYQWFAVWDVALSVSEIAHISAPDTRWGMLTRPGPTYWPLSAAGGGATILPQIMQLAS